MKDQTQLKSKVAVLEEWRSSDSPYVHEDDIYGAMDEYHTQFKPTPAEDKGIEGLHEAAKSYIECPNLPDDMMSGDYEYHAFKAGAAWQSQQGKEAETIRELTEALEYAREWVSNAKANQYVLEIIDKALKTKEE